MTAILNTWAKYTKEVVAWAMDKTSKPMPFASAPTATAISKAERLMEQALRRDAKWYVLLGCDAEALHLALSQHSSIIENLSQILIIEDDIQKARAFINTYSPLPQNVHILADTSPWALFMLSLEHLGLQQLSNDFTPLNADSALIHWVMPPTERSQTLNTWRKLFLGCKSMPLVQEACNSFKLSVGAIIHPDESHLSDFFEHIPEWVHEVIIIWDAAEVPHNALALAPKAKHFARLLNSDFAAQRNAMLSHCTGNWLLYLDADERISEDHWEQFAYMANSTQELAGVYFPRLTFEGDDQHMRMAHGLWPDLQLRFFPLQDGVHFKGTVHEKVQGLKGNFFIAPHLSLVHYSHIYKNEEELRQRLAIFNAAGSVEHKLSQAYPRLHKDFFDIWSNHKPHLLQLPN